MATAIAVIPEPVVESVNMTLSVREAQLILFLVGKCNGTSPEVEDIFAALKSAGIRTACSTIDVINIHDHSLTYPQQ